MDRLKMPLPGRLAAMLGLLSALLVAQAPLSAQDSPPAVTPLDALREHVSGIVRAAEPHFQYDALFPPGTEVLDVTLEDGGTSATILLNFRFHWRPFSSEQAAAVETSLREALGERLQPGAPLTVQVLRERDRATSAVWSMDDITTSPELIRERESGRTREAPALAAPVVQRASYAGPDINAGLAGRHIAVHPSHGWTWHKEYRWQLQRARVHTIAEDMFPMAYINPFFIPMLENAGAVVFSSRERDFQLDEVIVDNDGHDAVSALELKGDWRPGPARGWNGPRPIALDHATNPFELGTTIVAEIAAMPEAVVTPYIPREGSYAVYASWASGEDHSPAVPVEITHLGGITRVLVNQQVAGGTWVYLGSFRFGPNPDPKREAPANSPTTAQIRVLGEGAVPSYAAEMGGRPTLVSFDAIRLGGGMGNVAPKGGHLSGAPRYAEAARYFLQYAGMPVALMGLESWPVHFGEDYWTDIVGRGEFANWLMGAPHGPNADRTLAGLGVPIDLSLSWHTDAGFSETGLIGTHMIYAVPDQAGEMTYPDGRSRLLGRDLATLIMDEFVRTARELYTSQWARRMLQDRGLGEIRRPNVPSALIELLSHHNFNDMKYGIDPRFQHDMARAAYKAILRFVAAQNGFEPVVQPLHPTHLTMRALDAERAEITWRAQPDPIEPTAMPTGYLVHLSRDGKAFRPGFYVEAPPAVVTGEDLSMPLYARITAVNAGGESLPSRVVGARHSADSEAMGVLLVDGFDRVAPPAIIDEPGSRGFSMATDPGVGWHSHYGVVGDVYDLDPKSPWGNDLETPGWGGSDNSLEHRLIRGNTFNHVIEYAPALVQLGLGFDSMTQDAWSAGDAEGLETDAAIIWIAGRQRTQMPPKGIERGAPDRMQPAFQVLDAPARARLTAHLEAQGRLVLSGAYVMEDLTTGPLADADSRNFARNMLGLAASTPRATHSNTAAANPSAPEAFRSMRIVRFGRDLLPPINMLDTVYPVESAEALVPANNTWLPALIYGDTNRIAAMASERVTVVGFPIETALPPAGRVELIRASLGLLPEPPAAEATSAP